MKPARIVELQAGAAKDARQVADEIQVAEVGDAAELGVAQPIAPGAPLRDRGWSASSTVSWSGGQPTSGCVPAAGGSGGRGPGVHAPQEIQALLLHRLQIAGDAAVVADQLSAALGLGVGDVGVVEQLLERLAARGRQPVLERLAVLLDQEVRLEADVDVVPGQPRASPGGCRGSGPARPRSCSLLGDRLVPQVEAKAFVPAVEAAAEAERALEHVGAGAGRRARRCPRCATGGSRASSGRPAGAAAASASIACLRVGLRLAVHRRPLERRVRLGHVGRHRDRHLGAPKVATGRCPARAPRSRRCRARPRPPRSAGRS